MDKAHGGGVRGSRGNQAKASKSPVLEESHTRCLIPPQEREVRTRVKCYVRGMLITLGDQGLCRGLVMQAPPSWHVPTFQTLQKKSRCFSAKHIVCTNSLSTGCWEPSPDPNLQVSDKGQPCKPAFQRMAVLGLPTSSQGICVHWKVWWIKLGPSTSPLVTV